MPAAEARGREAGPRSAEGGRTLRGADEGDKGTGQRRPEAARERAAGREAADADRGRPRGPEPVGRPRWASRALSYRLGQPAAALYTYHL
jgi:hypothetical protein